MENSNHRIFNTSWSIKQLITIILCLFTVIGLSQNSITEDLEIELSKTEGKEARAEILLKLAKAYYFGEKSLNAAKESLALSQELNNPELISRAYTEIGWSYYSNLQMDSAEINVVRSIDIIENTEHYSAQMSAFNLRALLFMEFAQYDEAEANFLNAEKATDQVHIPEKQAIIANNLGLLYIKTKNYKKALAQHEKALELCLSQNNKICYTRSYHNLGVTYYKMQNYNQSYQWLMKSIKERKEIKYYNGVAESLCALANLFFELKENETESAILTNQLNVDGYNTPFDLLDEAENLPTIKTNMAVSLLINESRILGYRTGKNYKSAFLFLEKQKNLEDSLVLTDMNLSAIADLKIKYQNELLTAQNELKEIKLKEHRYGIFLLAGLTLILGALLTFLVLYFRQTKKVRELTYKKEMDQKLRAIDRLNNRIGEILDQKDIIELRPLSEINQLLENQLTEKEHEILKSISKGLTNKEIAQEQFISSNTVKFHLKNIYSKLDVENRKEAIKRIMAI